MLSCRCVVQDCSNRSNPKLGISLHKPKTSFERQKWKAFVRTHRANFNPKGLFKICSVHFTADCCERAVHVPGALRVTVAGAIPTIWKFWSGQFQSHVSERLAYGKYYRWNIVDLWSLFTRTLPGIAAFQLHAGIRKGKMLCTRTSFFLKHRPKLHAHWVMNRYDKNWKIKLWICRSISLHLQCFFFLLEN